MDGTRSTWSFDPGCRLHRTDQRGPAGQSRRHGERAALVDNNYALDGAGFNNSHHAGAPTLPNPDTLGEFTVQSSNFSARESRAGALVQLSTRSGGNRWSGSVFEYLRNDKMDARNLLRRRAPGFQEKPGGWWLARRSHHPEPDVHFQFLPGDHQARQSEPQTSHGSYGRPTRRRFHGAGQPDHRRSSQR